MIINNSSNKKYYSKSLTEHVEKGLGLESCMFRVGSYSFINMIAEVRMLVEEKLYTPNDFEKFLLENRDLGEWGIYDGKVVPLGLPMINEDWEEQNENELMEAEYKGRKVQLGKRKRGGSKKF
jgi:hypothetical protein